VSIQGTLGPLVQGPNGRARWAAVFVGSFIAGAVITFGVASAGAAAVESTSVPVHWRLVIAGSGLLLLVAVDLYASAKATHCPIGWSRQTPRKLLRGHPIGIVAAVWGFDTGLVVTTIRIAAVSWGALLLTALGFAPWWAGLGYGLGFTMPFLFLLFRSELGRRSRQAGPADPGLERMLGTRASIQVVSAALLFASAAILIGRVLVA
jgi:hypothetical protein